MLTLNYSACLVYYVCAYTLRSRLNELLLNDSFILHPKAVVETILYFLEGYKYFFSSTGSYCLYDNLKGYYRAP